MQLVGLSMNQLISEYRAANAAYRAALAKHSKAQPMPLELVTAIAHRLAAAMRLADAVEAGDVQE